MNKYFNPSLMKIFLLIALLYFAPVAAADDKWCWLEATIERAYVYVTEWDEDGANENRLWEGWIEQDERQKITSARGQINYDYRLASDDRTYGDNSADCDNGNTVTIP
jgi:hypothetical protein